MNPVGISLEFCLPGAPGHEGQVHDLLQWEQAATNCCCNDARNLHHSRLWARIASCALLDRVRLPRELPVL